MSTRRPMIAIVDDDARLLESLSDLLESAGYATRCHPSAAALREAGIGGVDLLITDVGMAGVDGFELRRRVLGLRPELPVFLITGRHEIADQERAQDIAHFFRKPFDTQVLLSAIADALKPTSEGEHGT